MTSKKEKSILTQNLFKIFDLQKREVHPSNSKIRLWDFFLCCKNDKRISFPHSDLCILVQKVKTCPVG